MPLERSTSRKAFSHNVREMVNAGHTQKQAVAAAYREQRSAKDARGGAFYMNSTAPHRVVPVNWRGGSSDMLRKAIISGQQEAKAQQQAVRLMRGEYVGGRDRKQAKRGRTP